MGPAQNVAVEVAEEAAPWQKGAPATGSGEAAPSPDGQLPADPPSDATSKDKLPTTSEITVVVAKPSEAAAAAADDGDAEKQPPKWPKGPNGISFNKMRTDPTLGPLYWEMERWLRHKWASWQHQEEVKWATATQIFEEVAQTPQFKRLSPTLKNMEIVLDSAGKSFIFRKDPTGGTELQYSCRHFRHEIDYNLPSKCPLFRQVLYRCGEEWPSKSILPMESIFKPKQIESWGPGWEMEAVITKLLTAFADFCTITFAEPNVVGVTTQITLATFDYSALNKYFVQLIKIPEDCECFITPKVEKEARRAEKANASWVMPDTIESKKPRQEEKTGKGTNQWQQYAPNYHNWQTGFHSGTSGQSSSWAPSSSSVPWKMQGK